MAYGPMMSLPKCVRPDIYYYMIANVGWMCWKFLVSFSIVPVGFYAISPVGFGGCIYQDVLFVVAGVVVYVYLFVRDYGRKMGCIPPEVKQEIWIASHLVFCVVQLDLPIAPTVYCGDSSDA
eukprot:464258-Amphidinium_carterae.1